MRRLAALTTAGLVLALLALAQLLLPGIAAQRLRDRLARSGRVVEVEVHAFPAVQLLWHHADRVLVRLGSYRSNPGRVGSLLHQAGDVGSLDASVQVLGTGLVTLRDATLRKRGDRLTGSALVTEADLRSALPFLQGVQPVASGGGTLTLRGTATLLGASATIDATVRVAGGRLVIGPDVPFGGLATLTVFANPHVAVQEIGATSTADGFSVSARALLR